MFMQNLEKNLQRFSEADNLYHQAIALHKKKLLKQIGSEIPYSDSASEKISSAANHPF